MEFGYKDLPIGVLNVGLKNINKELKIDVKRLKHNLTSLNNIIDYTVKHKIKVLRLGLDFILNFTGSLKFIEDISNDLNLIQNKIKKNNIRLIFDLENKINLNSTNQNVVNNSISDLNYFIQILNLLSKDFKSKILIHNILEPGDKHEFVNNFIENYLKLDSKVQDFLIIENNNEYTIEDVLEISNKVNIPVLYNNYYRKNLSKKKTDYYWIKKANKTWKKQDGNQIIQYTQRAKDNSLAKSINLKDFKELIKQVDYNLDIILYAKDNNLSTIKCLNLIKNNNIKHLEDEWSKYKYVILEKSPNNYNEIRQLLKNKKAYPVIEFYKIIEESLNKNENQGYTVNALEHVWGYFKKIATSKERETYVNLLSGYLAKVNKKSEVKDFLKILALKYEENYLLNSYYFILN